MVGRDKERDALWQALRRAADGSPQVVVLSAAPGHGARRLATWLCEQAHEVAGSNVLRARLRRGGGPAQGIGDALRDFYRTHRLSDGAARLRVRSELAMRGVSMPFVEDGVLALLRPGPRFFTESNERYEFVARLLEYLAGERPAVVWIDGAEHGADVLSLLQHIFTVPRYAPLRVLFVVTHRVDPAARTEAGALLRLLDDNPNARTVRVPALSVDEATTLAQSLLALSDDEARGLAKASGGSPLFVVHALDDHVHSGVTGPWPSSLADLWAGRLDRILDAESRHAVEAAAVLGNPVDEGEWRILCDRAGLPIPDGLLVLLSETRLVRQARPVGTEWSFVHDGIVDHIVSGIPSERATSLHSHAAALLGSPTTVEGRSRLGRHLLEAGRADEALEPLLEAVRAAKEADDMHAMARMAGILTDAIEAASRPTPAIRCAHLIGLAELHRLRNEQVRMHELLDEVEQIAVAHDLPEPLFDARLTRMLWERHHGSTQRAWDLTTLTAEALPADDHYRKARVTRHRAGQAVLMGRAAEAIGYAIDALAWYQTSGALEDIANTLVILGAAHLHLDDLEAAEDAFRDARRQTLNGFPQGCLATAEAANMLGEVARRRGELEEASAWYREAAWRFRSLGWFESAVAEANLGLVLAARDRHSEAVAVYLRAIDRAEAAGRKGFVGMLHAALLPSHAALGQWTDVARHLAAAEASLGETGLHDPDVAACADRAAVLARAAGRNSEARRCAALAEICRP